MVYGPKVVYLQLWLHLLFSVEGNEWHFELLVAHQIEGIVNLGDDPFFVVVAPVPPVAPAGIVPKGIAEVIDGVLQMNSTRH